MVQHCLALNISTFLVLKDLQRLLASASSSLRSPNTLNLVSLGFSFSQTTAFLDPLPTFLQVEPSLLSAMLLMHSSRLYLASMSAIIAA
jgi:hypothetical protein